MVPKNTTSKKEYNIVSHPLLHDIIKSEIDHNSKTVFDICKKIPSIKNSNLFKKEYWKFSESRQEQITKKYYQTDCIWFFDGKSQDNYYIIHEVKTGEYSIVDIYNKYHSGMNSQIWIWGWNQINNTKFIGDAYQRKIKLLDIEFLLPLIIRDIENIIQRVWT